jgi:hypothetical protein
MRQKLVRIAVAATVFGSLFLGLRQKVGAVWIGTGPVTGTITRLQSNDLHDLFFLTVTLSAPIPNCSGSPTAAIIPYKQPNGVVNVQYQTLMNLATSAKLSGTPVNIWADTVTYTVFGNASPVCTIHQLELQP